MELTNVLLYTLLVVFFVVGIDYNFIGITNYLFQGHKLFSWKEKVRYEIKVDRVVSSCFSEDGVLVELRHGFMQYDDKYGLSENYLYVGIRLLTYHYRINLHNVEDAAINFERAGKYKTSVVIRENGRSCIIEFGGRAVTKRRKEELQHFAHLLEQRAKQNA